MLAFDPAVLRSIPTNANYVEVMCYHAVFSPEECRRIISLVPADDLTEGRVGTDGRRDETIRRCRIYSLRWTEATEWLYRKLAAYVDLCNRANYGFDLVGFNEPLQFTEYQKGHFYGWHQDLFGPGPYMKRKLTTILILSHPDEYQGGDIDFSDFALDGPLPQGSLALFPSYRPHRAKAVTSGVRRVIVGWVGGPPFR